jgi:hypothetical protein
MPNDVPTFDKDVSPDELGYYLSQGIPVVVNGVQLQGVYDPAYFQAKYGHQTCVIEDCETGAQHRSKVGVFFETFGKPWLRNGEVWKLKVAFPYHLL